MFVRIGKRVKLSPCGMELYRRLESILPQIEAFPNVMQRVKYVSSNTLNIAVSTKDVLYDYPDLKLLRISDIECTRDIYLTWSPDAKFTKSMNVFYDFFNS